MWPVTSYRAQLFSFPSILFKSSGQGQITVIHLYLQTIVFNLNNVIIKSNVQVRSMHKSALFLYTVSLSLSLYSFLIYTSGAASGQDFIIICPKSGPNEACSGHTVIATLRSLVMLLSHLSTEQKIITKWICKSTTYSQKPVLQGSSEYYD